MNKLVLSLACTALAFGAASMDALARGGTVAGWSAGPAAAAPATGTSSIGAATNAPTTVSSSGSISSGPSSGTKAMLSPLASGQVQTSYNKQGGYQANTTYGYATPVTSPMAMARGTLMAANDTGALALNEYGVYVQVGALPGSMSSGKGVSLTGQSRVGGPALGVGNSQVGAAHMGIGNSEGSETAMIGAEGAGTSALAAFKASSPATATDIMNRVASLANRAMGSNATQGPSMGAPAIKACAGGSGAATTCN